MSTETLPRFPGRRLPRDHQQGGPPFVDPRPTWKIWLESIKSITGIDNPQFPPESLEAFVSTHKLIMNADTPANVSELETYLKDYPYGYRGYLPQLIQQAQTQGSVPFFKGAFNMDFVIPSVPRKELTPLDPPRIHPLNDYLYVYPITTYTCVYDISHGSIQIYMPQTRQVTAYMYDDYYSLAKHSLEDPNFSYLESYRAKQKS